MGVFERGVRRGCDRGFGMRIDNIKLALGESEQKLYDVAARKLHCAAHIRILRKSLDARDKKSIHWVYSIEADKKPVPAPVFSHPQVKRQPRRVAVVGSGPAGLFCALRLLAAGIAPTVVERGGTVEERAAQNASFFAGGALDEDCNVQFGEGGAGTFSDGKLNTQTKDPRNREVLETFVRFGAPQEIAYLNKPHIGSDRLRGVLVAMREHILRGGGQFLFHTRCENILAADGEVRALLLHDLKSGERYELPVSEAVLAIGHSSRDTFSMLAGRGFAMEARPFAVGARIEHLQSMVGQAQYGEAAALLPPADYKLSVPCGDRTAFTFCMCPGGVVLPAASERGGVVTNGMSDHARSGRNANSALLVSVGLEDFYRGGVLDGVAFQRVLEQAAYAAAGSKYAAPVQRTEDLLCGRVSRAFGEVLPTYAAGTAFCDLNALLPAPVAECMRAAIVQMDKKLRGFAHPDALLTGLETRFSSPVRVLRGGDLQSVSVCGVYPCGEGCGYSGGITSSAADGIRVAEAVCAKYER